MKNNKKYLILFVGVIVLFIIFIGVIFLQQTPAQQSSSSTPAAQTQITGSIKQTTQNTSPSVTLAPPSSSPKIAAQQFYIYYFSSPTNPLAYGAYKTNPYLAPEFKDNMSGAYKNGNVPVFCPQNKAANIVVGKEQSIYYGNSYLMQEVISQAPPGNKDLYTLRMQNVNGKWLVFDINCIFQ